MSKHYLIRAEFDNGADAADFFQVLGGKMTSDEAMARLRHREKVEDKKGQINPLLLFILFIITIFVLYLVSIGFF